MSAQLNAKQRRFADAYLGEAKGNGSKAAELAGYSQPRQAAHENLTKPHIRAYIDTRLDVETLSSAEVLHELSDVAGAEWREFVAVVMRGGKVVDVRMDLSSKVKALELLGKYRRLWEGDQGGVSQAAVVIHIDTVPGRLRATLLERHQLADGADGG